MTSVFIIAILVTNKLRSTYKEYRLKYTGQGSYLFNPCGSLLTLKQDTAKPLFSLLGKDFCFCFYTSKKHIPQNARTYLRNSPRKALHSCSEGRIIFCFSFIAVHKSFCDQLCYNLNSSLDSCGVCTKRLLIIWKMLLASCLVD